MMKQIQSPRFWVLSLLVLLAACSRFVPLAVPGLGNFTAVGALAVFAGAQFRDKRHAFFIPLLAMLLSDAFLGFHEGMPVVYAGFIAMVACGVLIKNAVKPLNIALASVAGSVTFFLITNFAFLYPWYPHNLQGVLQSYIMGLPFLRNMLIADAFYGTILFGFFHIMERRFDVLSFPKVKAA